MSANAGNKNSNNNNNNGNNDDSDDNQSSPVRMPPRRDRTPSIVVQSLGLSFRKDSNITESIELPGDEDEFSDSNEADPKSSTSGIDDGAQNDGSGGSTKGSQSSLQTSSPLNASSPVRSMKMPPAAAAATRLPPTNRRLSLNIGSTAPRRQSLTVDGLSSFINPALKESQQQQQGYNSGNATGSLRNKVALKPGHSLMGWIRLASTAKDLSGTNGKLIEVTADELAKHDKEEDCWVALKGNVYNVTTYLQYHPGGIEELMRGAGRDATELFNEVHRWVNYESILAKCLVGPYKLDSPSTPVGRASFATMTEGSTVDASAPTEAAAAATTIARKDPTVAQKPPRRQSIALTVPSPNKYQSLLLSNNLSTSTNQIQHPPTYVIMQDKTCIKLKIQDLNTLPLVRARHLICDLNDRMDLHLSVILSSDWLYRVHLHLDQQLDPQTLQAHLMDGNGGGANSDDSTTITVQLNKKESAIWNKIGTSLDLNDSLCEMTLADKFFRPCELISKQSLTHDTYLFEFKLDKTLMYVPIGWHVLIREYRPSELTELEQNQRQQETGYRVDDYRVHKNYTPVLGGGITDNDGLLDESGFMNSLCFIIKIYPNGALTSKLNQLEIGDSVDISDYQYVSDFDIENHVTKPKHWILLAAGTGITPFCRIISFLMAQSEEIVKSVDLVFFNKTQKDIIWRNEFDKVEKKHGTTRFKVTHVLSDEPTGSESLSPGYKLWTGKMGRINKTLLAEFLDSHNPDELQLLTCGPRPFTQLTKTLAGELNLQEKLYIFHG